MKTLVVLPAYNEANVLAETLSDLFGVVDVDALVVDDGSTDDTAHIAKDSNAAVARHIVNLGLGAALETGLEYARRRGYEQVVTFDADGQHNPEDVPLLLEALKDADVAIGVRVIHAERMPYVKKVGNTLLNVLTGLVFGVYSRDSQSGLRAFNRKAVESIRVCANRYEVSSEILYEAQRHDLKVKEVPVDVIYTKHSLSRGTSVADGFKILWKMILHDRGGR